MCDEVYSHQLSGLGEQSIPDKSVWLELMGSLEHYITLAEFIQKATEL